MTRLGGGVALACALALAALSLPAWSAEPSAEDRATARNLMDAGDESLGAGDVEGALEAYRGADAIMGVPTTAIEVGKAQAKLGMLVEAADTLNRVIRFPVENGEPGPYTKARDDARALMALVAKRTPSIKIVLDGVPSGAMVRAAIDDKLLPTGTVELPRKVNPGAHTVRATTGALGAVLEVTVTEGETKELILELEAGVDAGIPADAPPAPEPPPSPPDVGSTSDTPANAGGGISPLVWVGFGVGAAGLIAGGVTGGLTLAKEKDLESACPNEHCPPDQHGDLDGARTLAHVSTAMFAIGGAGVALGIVGLVISDFGGAVEAAVSPVFGPAFAGVQGRF